MKILIENFKQIKQITFLTSIYSIGFNGDDPMSYPKYSEFNFKNIHQKDKEILDRFLNILYTRGGGRGDGRSSYKFNHSLHMPWPMPWLGQVEI